MRERLADILQGIVAQRLLPQARRRGLVLASEVLVVTGTVREAIRSAEGNPPLKELMERGVHPVRHADLRDAPEAARHPGRHRKGRRAYRRRVLEGRFRGMEECGTVVDVDVDVDVDESVGTLPGSTTSHVARPRPRPISQFHGIETLAFAAGLGDQPGDPAHRVLYLGRLEEDRAEAPGGFEDRGFVAGRQKRDREARLRGAEALGELGAQPSPSSMSSSATEIEDGSTSRPPARSPRP